MLKKTPVQVAAINNSLGGCSGIKDIPVGQLKSHNPSHEAVQTPSNAGEKRIDP